MSRRPEKGRDAAGVSVRSDEPEPPFSRPFSVDELLRRPGDPLTIAAEPHELETLARTDGIPAIGALEAEFRVSEQGKEIRVAGEVRARITQECVVTLEPFESELVEPVDVRFAFAASPAAPEPPSRERMSRRRQTQAQAAQERRARHAPDFPAHEEDDPPDPIVGGKIDLGALAAEFMALGLDPYPRKPGAEFASAEFEDEADESPFAQLARLKKEE